jgi:predicted GNAT family acetyltransferase
MPRPFRVDRLQAFMSVVRGEPLGPGEPLLRRARYEDVNELVPLVARYRVEDGLSSADEDHTVWIRAHTIERIGAGHLYVLEVAGRIVFTGAFNFAGRHGAGLGGIYTLPEARGRGIAARATSELCRIALRLGPAATLHVDPRNAPAIRAYEKAGLRRTGDFRLTFR